MSKSQLKRIAVQTDLKALANFLARAVQTMALSPSKGYNKRVCNIQVYDECDSGDIEIGDGWELNQAEAMQLIAAIDAARQGKE